MPTLKFPLPVVESGRVYAAGTLAREIVNFQRTSQDTLRSVRGPCPLIPNYGAGYPAQYARMYGVYHARLQKGVRDVVMMRMGSTLVEQRGWQRNVRTLASGLSPDPNQRFADQFCTVGGKIIWTNGRDRARIYDGHTMLPLGYTVTPASPSARGPTASGHPVFANDTAYSHPGKVGSVGEVYADDEGTLLPFTRYYAVQFEDAFGNLSPISAFGGPTTLRTERTAGFYWDDYANYPDPTFLGLGMASLGLLSIRLDDLTKQFWIDGIPVGPSGTVARHILCTENAVTKGNTLRKAVRIPDNMTTSIPDNFPDSVLGAPAPEVIPVPVFGVMCAYQGGLAIAVGPRVYLSQPGFPGTFLRTRYVEPDPRGGEVTGLAVWQGMLVAFTETSTFTILDDAEGLRTRPLTQGIGCVAPSSVQSTPEGLLWLARDGFYRMDAQGQVECVSREIDTLFTRLNTASLGQSTAVWRSATREYLCAVPEAGMYGNSLVLVFDGVGWRRLRYGIAFAGLFETQDWTQRLLAVGQRTDTSEHNVFVLDAEHRNYAPPTKTSVFRTTWLKPDVLGMQRFSSATVYIGVVEMGTHTFEVRAYQNYRMDQLVGAAVTRTCGAPDLARLVVATNLGTLVIGTDTVRTPRMTWKKVNLGRIKSAECLSFEVRCTEPGYTHIHAIAFQFEVEAAGEMVSAE